MRRKDNKRRIQKKAPLGVCGKCFPSPHRPTPVVIPSYAEKGNTFRIQKKGQQQVSNQIFAAKGQEQYAPFVSLLRID